MTSDTLAARGAPMWCDGCRAIGAIHCAHPDQCGNMLSATASADQWKAWLDDLPLPYTFDPANGRLQDFITALTTLIDVPQPSQPSTPTALAASPEVAKLIREAEARGMERAAERLDLAEHDAEERDWRSGANAFSALAHAIRAEAAALKGAKP